MRLIDADALMDEANSDGAYGYVDAKQISEALTVDAVPVVRCEYCNKGHPELGMNGCVWCVRYSRDMNTDDFCSYGEQKGCAD